MVNYYYIIIVLLFTCIIVVYCIILLLCYCILADINASDLPRFTGDYRRSVVHGR